LKILILFLTMLVVVPAGTHLFALPNKIGLPRDAYFTVQGIYAGWAWFGAVILAAIVANLVLAWRLWQYDRSAALSAACSAALLAVGLAIFFTWTFPANQATANWTVVPDGWQQLRRQWEYGHAAGALVTFGALCAVTLAALDAERRA
jgi:hypothetical protein